MFLVFLKKKYIYLNFVFKNLFDLHRIFHCDGKIKKSLILSQTLYPKLKINKGNNCDESFITLHEESNVLRYK